MKKDKTAAKNILNWILIGLVIVALSILAYCLLSFALYAAVVVPN